MAKLRIYQPAKTAMQSGRARSRHWVVEFAPGMAQRSDPLMGWCGRGDTSRQVQLRFDSREQAVAYAEKHGLDYDVDTPRARRVRVRSYSDNFSAGRTTNWTH